MVYKWLCIGSAVVLIAACATGGDEANDDDDGSTSTGAGGTTSSGGAGGIGGMGTPGSGGTPSTGGMGVGPGPGGMGPSTGGGVGSGGSPPSTLSCYSADPGTCEPGVVSSCNAAENCAPTTADDWQCFPNGTSPVGSSCNATTGNPMCVMGAICVNTGTDTCLRLCCSTSDCPIQTETCQELSGGNLIIRACL